jgi:hypothetical protein
MKMNAHQLAAIALRFRQDCQRFGLDPHSTLAHCLADAKARYDAGAPPEPAPGRTLFTPSRFPWIGPGLARRDSGAAKPRGACPI